MSDKLTGVVKWFDPEKGFGFIIPRDGSGEIFVHQSEIVASGFRSLEQDEEVEFSLIFQDGRRKAGAVTGPGGRPVKGGEPRTERSGRGGRGGSSGSCAGGRSFRNESEPASTRRENGYGRERERDYDDRDREYDRRGGASYDREKRSYDRYDDRGSFQDERRGGDRGVSPREAASAYEDRGFRRTVNSCDGSRKGANSYDRGANSLSVGTDYSSGNPSVTSNYLSADYDNHYDNSASVRTSREGIRDNY